MGKKIRSMLITFSKETTKKLLNRINFEPEILTLLDQRYEVYLAGGALRGCFGKNERIEDYDLFFYTSEVVTYVEEFFKEYGYNIVFRCPEGKLLTLKNKERNIKVQLITERYYDSDPDLINSFDINACRISLNQGRITTEYDVIRDIRRKQISLFNIPYPVATFKRIMKYISKGYSISNQSIQHYVNDIYNKGLDQDNSISFRFYVD